MYDNLLNVINVQLINHLHKGELSREKWINIQNKKSIINLKNQKVTRGLHFYISVGQVVLTSLFDMGYIAGVVGATLKAW